MADAGLAAHHRMGTRFDMIAPVSLSMIFEQGRGGQSKGGPLQSTRHARPQALRRDGPHT